MKIFAELCQLFCSLFTLIMSVLMMTGKLKLVW